MPSHRVIVDVVTEIAPRVEKPTDRCFEANPDGFLCTFRGGETARLGPSKLGPAILDILDDLCQQRAPVYVEVAEDSGAIVAIRIPAILQVEEVREGKSGAIEVVLFPSHARHTLNRENENFDALFETLTGAQERDEWLLVTETDDHEIIDARPFRPSGGHGIPLKAQGLDRLKSVILDEWLVWIHRWLRSRLCSWLCWPKRFCLCVSSKKAWEMFNMVAAKSCNPTTPQAPCIPFLYPDDGCWARAHEMCRLMTAAGVSSAKVWINGDLEAATRNTPYCAVHWGWHVAPTLCVRTHLCWSRTYVIDPALFTGPVSVQTWKSVQGDPNATLTHTSASIYWRNYMPSDPGYVDTNIRLTYYRNKLKLRSTTEVNSANQLWGPPPYAHC